MSEFNLLNPVFSNEGLKLKSSDGNGIFVFQLSPYHHLTDSQAANLRAVLYDYQNALGACVVALLQVVEWVDRPIKSGGSFDDLIKVLPDVKEALMLAGIDLDETAVNSL